jgi:heat shock protein HtpX
MRAWLVGMRQVLSVMLVVASPLLIVGFVLGGDAGLVVGLIAALAVELSAWLFSRPILMSICEASPVGAGEYPNLIQAVERLAASAGIAKPTVAVSSLPLPNALAAVTPGGGLICVTSGLMAMLSPAELDAVLAHEIAHLTQPGRAGATIAAVFAALPGAITVANGTDFYFELPYRRHQRTVRGGRRSNPARQAIAQVTAPLAAILIRLSTSSREEFVADARAARMTHDPATLTTALRKLQSLAGRIAWPVNPAIAHLLVIHPFGSLPLGQLFNTHPSTPERLSVLSDRATG